MSTTQIRPSHPILIPELLALTLSFLDEKSLAKTAIVCRQWAGIALDASWRNVTDLRRLLGLLGPFIMQTQYGRGNYTTHTYVSSFSFPSSLYVQAALSRLLSYRN